MDSTALSAELDRLATLGLSVEDMDLVKQIANHWVNNRAELVVREDGRGEVRSTVGHLNFHLEPHALGTEPRTWSLVYEVKHGGVEQEHHGSTIRERGERLEIVSRSPVFSFETTIYLVRSTSK